MYSSRYANAGGGKEPHIQDYARFGSTNIYLTWRKLITWSVIGWICLLILSSFKSVPILSTSTSSFIPDSAESLVAYRPKVQRQILDDIPKHFCDASKKSGEISTKLVYLGHPDYPETLKDDSNICSWKERSAAVIPFRVCTYDPEIDTVISAAIQSQGDFNSYKLRLLERLLPVITDNVDTEVLEGRNVVVDVGSGLGTYAMMAAMRGYDVISFDPLVPTLKRQLLSFYDNGILVGESLHDRGSGVGKTRRPIVHVFENAVGNVNTVGRITFDAQNPGAARVSPQGDQTTKLIKLDDFFDLSLAKVGIEKKRFSMRKKKNLAGLTKSGSPLQDNEEVGSSFNALPKEERDYIISLINGEVTDPRRIRLLKIAAEGLEGHVLDGALNLIFSVKIPYVVLTYFHGSIVDSGCRASLVLDSFLSRGYSIYHLGTMIRRKEDLVRFQKGMQNTRMELVLVAPGIPWL